MGGTVASNPAGVRVDLLHFLKCDGKDLIVLAGALLIGGVVAAFDWKIALLIIGIGGFVAIASMVSAPEIFREGDVCPAVVVDPDRQLVAVMANLSKTARGAPVIKILRQPLRRAVQRPVKRGTRLAFIAMYNGRPSAPAWANFGGYLVDSGTRSTKAIQRVLSNISEPEWERLLSSMSSMKKPFQPGLYDMSAGKSRTSAEGASVRFVRRPGQIRIRPGFAIGVVVVFAPLVYIVARARGFGGGANAGGGGNPVPLAAPFAVRPDPVVNMNRMELGWPGANNRPDLQPPADAVDDDPGFGLPRASEEANPATAVASPFRPVTPASPMPNGAFGDQDAVRPAPPMQKAEWRIGQKAEAFWADNWLPVTVLAVQRNGELKVHWEGYDDAFDEVLPPNRLRPGRADSQKFGPPNQ